ncbi:MAG: hypothetical protein NTV34_12700 [Proteobacteria bacterium]|nr:hypothetical protein [Pseudomonadota bacterium]
MNIRHRRAILWTFGVLVALGAPIAYLMSLNLKAGKIARPSLGEVGTFIYRDVTGEAVTRDSLYKGLTFVINLPKRCSLKLCPNESANAMLASKWVSDNLTIPYTEEKNPLNLMVTGGSSVIVPGWRVIPENLNVGTLVPIGYDPEQSWLAVIDPWLDFAGAWNLSVPLDQTSMERVLSRASFEQYLGNYLAKRTFMGPRKNSQK